MPTACTARRVDTRSVQRSEIVSRRGVTLIAVAALLLCAPPGASARVFKDVIATPYQNWVFLDKFVFDSTGNGVFKWQIILENSANDNTAASGAAVSCNSCVANSTSGEVKPCSQVPENEQMTFTDCTVNTKVSAKLLFYDDEWKGSVGSFTALVEDYKELTCEDRTAMAVESIGLEVGISNGGEINVAASNRPHEWFVVLADCQNQGLLADVNVTFLNSGYLENHYNAHLGVNEQGIYEMNIFFVVMYGAYGLLMLFVVKKFMDNNVMHPLHWMILGSFQMYLIHHIAEICHWLNYSQTGIGLEVAQVIAEWTQVVGFLMFLNVLFLIARGWMITTNKLSRKSENAFFTVTITLIYVGLFFSDIGRERYDSSYRYATWAGYMFIAMNVILLGFFLSLLRRTSFFEKRIVKRSFYKRFGFVFSLWFLQLPIFVLVALLLPEYYRHKVLFGLERCVQLTAFLLLPALSQPKRTYETYSVTNNFEQRIPARQAQQRIIPISQGGTLLIPQHQLAGQLPGGLPPVNRDMSTSLEEADRRFTEQEQELGERVNTRHSASDEENGSQEQREGLRNVRGGEGIID